MAKDNARDAPDRQSDDATCATCLDRPQPGHYCADCGMIGAG
jgi:hypothetical protein